MTTTLSKVSRVPNGSPVPPPSLDCDFLKRTLDQLSAFAKTDSFKAATSLVNEANGLRAKLKTKDSEILTLRQELENQEQSNDEAIKRISGSLGRATSRQKGFEERIESLQKSLAGREQKLKGEEERNRSLNGQIEALQEKGREAEANLKSSHQDSVILMDKLKTSSNALESLKATKSTLDEAISSEKRKTADLEAKLKESAKRLQGMQSELDTVRSFCVRRDIDQELIGDEYNKLWKLATKELSHVLSKNLPEEALQDDGRWSKLTKQTRDLMAPYHLAMPASNSPAAKGMRVVVVLATLSRKIDQEIFQPNYLTADSNDLRGVLNNQAETDVKREAHFRSVLLAIDPALQNQNLNSRAQRVLDEVSQGLRPLLSATHFSAFQASVNKVIESAIKLWRDIQASPYKFETNFEPTNYGENWDQFEFPGFKDGIDDGVLRRQSLTVYPQLSLVDEGQWQCQEYVILLPQSHKLCNLAAEEMTQNPSSPIINSLPSKRPRRPSLSINGAQTNGKRVPLAEVIKNGAR